MRTFRDFLQRVTLTSAALALVLCGANNASAGVPVGWFDDFNDGSFDDGNPVTWTPLTLLPGDYDASSGDFVLSGVDDFFNDESQIATVEDVIFGTTSVRTRAVVEDLTPDPENTVSGNVGVVARYDPNTVSGYVVVLDDGDHLSIIRVDGGAPSFDIATDPDSTYSAAEDIMIQLDVTGTGNSTLLEVTIWDPDDPMPSTPQFSGFDLSGFGGLETGAAGIVNNEDEDASAGIFRFAQASSEKIVDIICAGEADFDCDGDVDGDDFLAWQGGFGIATGATKSDGDYDNDGDVDGDDFLGWQSEFGNGGGSGAVPEPSTVVLAILAALFCGVVSMRKRLG